MKKQYKKLRAIIIIGAGQREFTWKGRPDTGKLEFENVVDLLYHKEQRSLIYP